MLIMTALAITEAEVKENELECNLVDYASIVAADLNELGTFEGCNQPPAYSVALKPAEDMVIPFFLCSIHFNAVKISMRDRKLGIDEDIFGSSKD